MVDELRGNPASPGAAAGPVVRLTPPPVLPEHWDTPSAPEEELAAATEALDAAVADLEKRAATVSGESKSIMDTQIMMAQDPTLRTGIQEGWPPTAPPPGRSATRSASTWPRWRPSAATSASGRPT